MIVLFLIRLLLYRDMIVLFLIRLLLLYLYYIYTNLHPAITCLSTMISTSFSPVLQSDPILNMIIPPTSLVVAYRKLPNLMRYLCSPDQNKFLSQPPLNNVCGYLDTGCRCMVCKVSNFGRFASSPSLPWVQATYSGTSFMQKRAGSCLPFDLQVWETWVQEGSLCGYGFNIKA